jgi:pyruvate, orthophosphate dikinase
VVALSLGKCCVTGARGIAIDSVAGRVRIGAQTLAQGDWISLDGSTGRVFAGKLPLRSRSEDHPQLDQLLAWASDIDSCKVRGNADTPADALIAIKNGAAGIGLCRTEHMFFAADRLQHVRAMIMAATTAERLTALEHLLPIQQGDFEALFRTMSPMPVTIRLLDPPLHEFLPSSLDIEIEFAAARGEEDWERYVELQGLRKQMQALSETNPMMGHRGCRLLLTYPEILRMQVRAILQAAIAVSSEGFEPHPEIMVPLVSSEQEMRVLANLIHGTASELFTAEGTRVDYRIGTMIELPRAAVCAGPIAKHVSFISFGTNDLTQMTYGFSRDDASSYLGSYMEQGIFTDDPFMTIDRDGVGELMRMAIASVRRVDPSIKIGVCGEHGGDPESIAFFHTLGLDYVSCSPSRLLVARLAVAQAGLMLFEPEETPEQALAC